MRRGTSGILGVLTLLAAFASASPALAQTQQPAARPADARPGTDFRAAFRRQIEDELALLRPRLKLAEDEGKEQAERYKEMAASKAEMARKAAEQAEASRARADAAAAKKGYAPKVPGKGGAGKKGAAADAKAAGADKAGDAGGAGAAPRKVDPVLTQQYVVMGLRDQVRHLRERIAYLEGLLKNL